MDQTLNYTSDRKQFDKELIGFQLVQAKLADMYTTLQGSRSMLY